MTGKWPGLVVPLVVLALGCGQSEETGKNQDQPTTESVSATRGDEQAASKTIQAMLKVCESGDWETYVDRYYGETHKFGSPDDRLALVRRFEEQWGASVVVALREASTITPVIEGNRAVFKTEDRLVFVLHKSGRNAWTFHL